MKAILISLLFVIVLPSFAGVNLSCRVIDFTITEMSYHYEPLDNISEFIINEEYLPVNVVADGRSLNEVLLNSGEKDYDEVMRRSLACIDVTRNDEDALVFEMWNDWDVWELEVDLRRIAPGKFIGTIMALWDDGYFYYVRCDQM